MTQYRKKKPDVIEAWPVRELNRAAGHEWKALPQSVRDDYSQGGWVFGVFKTDNDATSGRGIYIPTLAGSLWAAPEDMVIRGVNGEFYPCKPDIFAASYEPVAPPMTPADPIPPPVTPEPSDVRQKARLVRIEAHEESVAPWRPELLDAAAMLDAFADLLEARAARPSPTCATCKHLGRASDETGERYAYCKALRGFDVTDTPDNFGCTLHEPAPPAQDGGIK